MINRSKRQKKPPVANRQWHEAGVKSGFVTTEPRDPDYLFQMALFLKDAAKQLEACNLIDLTEKVNARYGLTATVGALHYYLNQMYFLEVQQLLVFSISPEIETEMNEQSKGRK